MAVIPQWTAPEVARVRPASALTFQGIPLVVDETLGHGHVALYQSSAEAAKAVIEAGHEYSLAKTGQGAG